MKIKSLFLENVRSRQKYKVLRSLVKSFFTACLRPVIVQLSDKNNILSTSLAFPIPLSVCSPLPLLVNFLLQQSITPFYKIN